MKANSISTIVIPIGEKVKPARSNFYLDGRALFKKFIKDKLSVYLFTRKIFTTPAVKKIIFANQAVSKGLRSPL